MRPTMERSDRVLLLNTPDVVQRAHFSNLIRDSVPGRK